MRDDSEAPRFVSRGITALIATKWKVGTVFHMAGISSFTRDSATAASFSGGGAGTRLIMMPRTTVPIDYVSAFPGEKEDLSGMQTICTVMSRLPPMLRAQPAGLPPPTVEWRVAGALRMWKGARYIFKGFERRYVQPHVRINGQHDEGGSPPLFDAYDRIVRQRTTQVVRLRGGAGTGKTSNMLATAAHEMDRAEPAGAAQSGAQRGVVWCALPWATGSEWGDMLTPNAKKPDLSSSGASKPRGALEEMIAKVMTGERSDIAHIRPLPVTYFLDGGDEMKACRVSDVLRNTDFLSRGGIQLDEWPNAVFVIAMRD
eukprot:gene43745-62718_t